MAYLVVFALGFGSGAYVVLRAFGGALHRLLGRR